MKLKDKYEELQTLYEDRFRGCFDLTKDGANIPLSNIVGDTGYTGDGTINLAADMAWRMVSGQRLEAERDVTAVRRLISACYDMFRSKYDSPTLKKVEGFFMRDDVDETRPELYRVGRIVNAAVEDREDPCFSMYESQDQIWHLVPMLEAMYQKYVQEDEAGKLVHDILKWVIDCNHTIKHPYFSTMYWDWLYEDPKVPYEKRTQVRADKLKYKVNVKRGAYNWWLAYLFRKVARQHSAGSEFGYLMYRLWQAPLMELLHWTFFPLLRKLQGSWDREYPLYSMNIVTHSSLWIERYVTKFMNEIKEGRLFMPNMLAMVGAGRFVARKNYVDFKAFLIKALGEYQAVEGDRIESPIDFLITYSVFESVLVDEEY